jgi:hypothetical protein
MTDKIKLIDEISEYHPASEAGIRRNWSTYTGGMADTGTWFNWKMLKEASIEELELCLSELKEEWKPKPKVELSEEDKIKQKKVTLHDNIMSNQYIDEKMVAFGRDLEYKLLFGK